MLTPGAYLAKRRTSAGLTIADVASAVATVPHVAEHVRAEWLELIERDEMPAAFSTIAVLRHVFPFDLRILAQLVSYSIDPASPRPRICRVCACSQFDACRLNCRWVDYDLCSSCAPDEARDAIDPPQACAA